MIHIGHSSGEKILQNWWNHHSWSKEHQKNVKADQVSKQLIHHHDSYWSIKWYIVVVRVKSVRKSFEFIFWFWSFTIGSLQTFCPVELLTVLVQNLSQLLDSTSQRFQNKQQPSTDNHVASDWQLILNGRLTSWRNNQSPSCPPLATTKNAASWGSYFLDLRTTYFKDDTFSW